MSELKCGASAGLTTSWERREALEGLAAPGNTPDKDNLQQPTPEDALSAARAAVEALPSRLLDSQHTEEIATNLAPDFARFAAQREAAASVSGDARETAGAITKVIVDEMGAEIGWHWIIKPSSWRERIAAHLSAALQSERAATAAQTAAVVQCCEVGLCVGAAKARREALSDAEKWHWQRYTALRDSSPRSNDGLVSGMAGTRMHEHREAAEHFARAALTPQNTSEDK